MIVLMHVTPDIRLNLLQSDSIWRGVAQPRLVDFDILYRSVVFVGPDSLQPLDSLHSRRHSAKDSVLAIKEWRWCLDVSPLQVLLPTQVMKNWEPAVSMNPKSGHSRGIGPSNTNHTYQAGGMLIEWPFRAHFETAGLSFFFESHPLHQTCPSVSQQFRRPCAMPIAQLSHTQTHR